jgi:outer membrane protein assembly factor BamB
MKSAKLFAVLPWMLLVAGCGGASGGGSGTITPPAISLSSSSGSASAYENAAPPAFTVTATVSGSAKTPIVADLKYDATVFSSVTASPKAGGGYTILATPRATLGGGDYTGMIDFRLCQEAACTNVYAGTAVSYTYKLTVKLLDWGMYQRNAAHTGYVHAQLDASKFQEAWTWSNPDDNYISWAVAGDGNVYISAAPGKTYAFAETTGSQVWVNAMANPTALYGRGGLAFYKGTLYVAAYGPSTGSYYSGGATIRGVDAATGAFKTDSSFVSQVNTYNSPTILDDEMFYTQGYYGGIISKYSLPSGTTSWTNTYVQTNQFGGEAPAVDDRYVYSTNGWGLIVYNKSDGSIYKTVSRARTISTGYQSFISPVITSSGKVIYFNQEDNGLHAVDVATGTTIWQTSYNYNLQPVVRGNVIYTSRNYPYQVEALSETDGSLLWSWSMPATDTRFIENMIVCDNLLFVSTDKATYAIDLTTHQTVWSTKAHGALALSANYMLYIVTNDYAKTGVLTAIRLRS